MHKYRIRDIVYLALTILCLPFPCTYPIAQVIMFSHHRVWAVTTLVPLLLPLLLGGAHASSALRTVAMHSQGSCHQQISSVSVHDDECFETMPGPSLVHCFEANNTVRYDLGSNSDNCLTTHFPIVGSFWSSLQDGIACLDLNYNTFFAWVNCSFTIAQNNTDNALVSSTGSGSGSGSESGAGSMSGGGGMASSSSAMSSSSSAMYMSSSATSSGHTVVLPNHIMILLLMSIYALLGCVK